MIKVDNLSVMNIDGALRGMRNPLASWDKSDSGWVVDNTIIAPLLEKKTYNIGPNDLKLAQNLINAGSDERKFMRQILVSMDITAPLFWWKEMDTYKVATVSNSTSTMHKLSQTPLDVNLFSFEDCPGDIAYHVVKECEYLRTQFLSTGDVRYWRALIELLPESFNQTRTWTANYETLRNIYFARKNHKLKEWREFCRQIENFPYGKELICYVKEESGDE